MVYLKSVFLRGYLIFSLKKKLLFLPYLLWILPPAPPPPLKLLMESRLLEWL